LTAIPTEEAPEPLQSAKYLYDGDGNLVKSVVNSTLGHTTTTYFPGKHYSVEEKGGALKVQKHYAAGSTIIAVRTITAEADTLQWMISDQLGSTSTTANADGTWNSDIRYTAFGEIRLKTGVTASGYRYTGQLDMQGSIGLDYYVSRFYDPQLARFAQADSMIPDPGKSVSFDRYAYVKNNPIIYADPTGHKWVCTGANSDHCYDDGQGKKSGMVTSIPSSVYQLKKPSYLETIKQKSSSDSPYMESWVNFETAWEIYTNPNATIIDRYATANYISIWGGAHIVLVTGVLGFGCVVAGPGCVAAVEGALGIGGALNADGNPINEIQVISTGTYSVYQYIEDGVVKYYGMTSDFFRRAGQHLNSRGWTIEKIPGLFNNLSKFDAHAVEQTLIEQAGIENLENIRNGIAASNPIYGDAIQRGNDILRLLNIVN
jgi:RHS repeat-associated protein